METGVVRGDIDVVLNGSNLARFNPSIDGMTIRRELGIPSDAPLVLQMGRIFERKRQEDLVRAFAIARRRVPDLRCLIVGWDTPTRSGEFDTYGARLEHLRKEECLGDSLIISPARADAPHLMAAADIVVMPSLEEPFGLVVAEAMASGRPVIAAASGGIPEMIVDGKTGFLVAPRSPSDLADRLALLAGDASLRRLMGIAARRHAEEHLDETRLAHEFAPIYERLVS